MATSKAKASAKKLARSSSNEIPKGMKAINGNFAPNWNPEDVPILQGTFGEIKNVPLKQGNKTVERRCTKFTTENGEDYTVWESAGLKAMFDDVEPGTDVYIRYDGLGTAKKGQNAPKLFTVAVSD
jgi:hypothetical protein